MIQLANQNLGTLYIVATPIGNLGDISIRAIDILKSVCLILCEDTRQSKKLLTHYQIQTKTSSLHTHNEKRQSEKAINLLKEGKNIAIISDAGTPAINDPGAILVNLAHHNQIKVSPIAGASSLSALVSVSGIKAEFSFWGFVPKKSNQSEQFIKKLMNHSLCSVFFVAKSKIIETVEQIHTINPNQVIVLAKEISKIYETIIKAETNQVLNWLQQDLAHQKGEFVILIEKNSNNLSNNELDKQMTKLKDCLEILLEQKISASQSAKIASKMLDLPKNLCYQIATELAKKSNLN